MVIDSIHGNGYGIHTAGHQQPPGAIPTPTGPSANLFRSGPMRSLRRARVDDGKSCAVSVRETARDASVLLASFIQPVPVLALFLGYVALVTIGDCPSFAQDRLAISWRTDIECQAFHIADFRSYNLAQQGGATMGKIVECAKVDPSSGCKHVVRGNTEQEVLKNAAEHAKQHGIREVTPELKAKVQAAIRDEK